MKAGVVIRKLVRGRYGSGLFSCVFLGWAWGYTLAHLSVLLRARLFIGGFSTIRGLQHILPADYGFASWPYCNFQNLGKALPRTKAALP
jgi:hypothetical protein